MANAFSSFFRRHRRKFFGVVLALLAWFLLHVAVMLKVGFTDDTRPADAAIVLGNFVDLQGNVGDVVKPRCDRAVELYKAGVVKHIVVSGATAPGGYSEPRGMANYCVSQGVRANDITEDPRGVNTFNTALNTRTLMRERGWRRVIVVSQYYHILRTRYAFRRMGIDDVGTAHSWYGFLIGEPRSVVREFVGFYRYVFRRYPSSEKD